MPNKKKKDNLNRETVYYLIEQGTDIVIKEKEGRKKHGDPAQQRVSRFRSPENVIIYLKEKYGETA